MLLRGLICFSLLFLPACQKVEPAAQSNAVAAIDTHAKPTCIQTSLPSPPLLNGWVTDAADVFSQVETDRLSKRFWDWEKSSGHQIVAVTVPTLSGVAIDTYACNLANAWEIGDKERNDGVLILYAMKEHEVRIAIGTGLESRLSNSFLLGVIQHNMMPHLKSGHYSNATEAALEKIAQKLRD
jgi:uncharacterized protein